MTSSISTLQNIKTRAVDMNASDIFFSAGSKPACRVYGNTIFFEEEEAISSDLLEKYLEEILSEEEQKRLKEEWELDFSLKSPGDNFFRVNVTRQTNGIGISFRVIPKQIPGFNTLDLPDQLKKIVDFKSGLVLVTGAMGSGKSTTLASILDLINKNHEKRIVTIEDPVEFIHNNNKSLIEHRELEIHTKGFRQSLKSALRQGCDVILLGELRDLESISLAVTAAETGTLVLSTLHTAGASNTINRLIDVFPPDQQHQVKAQLAQSLKAVVWQTLLPKKEGKGRTPAVEILFQNYAVSNLIREGKYHEINSVIETGQSEGMISMRRMLNYLVKEEMVDKEAAEKVFPEEMKDY